MNQEFNLKIRKFFNAISYAPEPRHPLGFAVLPVGSNVVPYYNLTMSMKKEERAILLKTLGFINEEGADTYSHKMFCGGFFRFENSDPDVFWTMDVIFKTCLEHGKKQKAESIRRELYV